MLKSGLYLILAGTSLLASTVAFAQDTPHPAPPAAAEDKANVGVSDIIVTAQRREERLINVPLSIQALSGKSLTATGIKGIAELTFTSPGLFVRSSGGYTDVFIRGIGNAVDVGAEPSVTTFVDDVPHIYGSLISDFVNVERIEILKGAQGGLYGRNATGGVINVITKQPSNKLEFEGRTSYGSYNTWNSSLYLNVPLSPTLAWNISASRNYHKPYYKNIAPKAPFVDGYPGDAPGSGLSFLNAHQKPGPMFDGNVWGLDTKLRWQATDNFKITVGADFTKKKDTDGNQYIDQDYGLAAQTWDAYLHGALGLAGYAANANQIAHIENTYFRRPGKGKIYGAYPFWSNTRDYGLSVRAVYSLPTIDITNITAYRWNDSGFQGDIGGGPVAMAGFVVRVFRHYLYQELRAQNTDKGRLHLLGGATYFTDRVNFRINGQFLGNTLGTTQSLEHTTDWSAYGQAGYDLTDRLTLTASLRYIHERRDITFINGEGSQGSEHKLLPAATLSYRTDGGTIYARFAEGYKTGGVNEVQFPSRYLQGCTPQQIADKICVTNTTFKGESVKTYEIGYRTNLFNNQVQLTTAIFYNDYKNLQVVLAGNAANPDVSQTYVNAGAARTYGAEASVTWRVSRPLTLSGNIGYLNARYKNFSFPGNHVVDGFDYSGNQMQMAPKWQGGFNIALDQPVTDKVHLIGNLLYSYVGAMYFQPNQDPTAHAKGYSLVTTRLGVRTDDNRYGIYLDVQNLFDKFYAIAGNSFAVPGSALFRGTVLPGTPRVIKGTLEVKF